MAANQSVTLFISYAHRDEGLKTQLDKHLTPLKLQKIIEKWSDRQIEGGQDWAHQIDSNLKSADIILLLVSPDFVSSEYCAGVELQEAMKRYRSGDAVVVPVILEPCDWKWLDFGKLQATPKDGKAITDWPNINSAFLDVINNIRQIAQGLLDQRQKKLDEKLAAAARYKSKVEEVLSDGDITPLERKTLNELRDLLGLTAAEAEAIKDSAYQPLREYQSKLVQYRVDLMETIQAEYPLSEHTTADLKQRQRELGLKVDDAERLEAELLCDAEARHQASLKAGEAAQQRARDEAALRAAEQAQREALDAAQREADSARRQAEAAQQAAAAQATAQAQAQAAQRAEAEAALQAAAARRAATEAARQADTEAARQAQTQAAAQAEAQAAAAAAEVQRRADDERQRQADQQARQAAEAQLRQRAEAAALRPAEPLLAAVAAPPAPVAAPLQSADRVDPPAASQAAPTPNARRPAAAAPAAAPTTAPITAFPAAPAPGNPSPPGNARMPGALIGGVVCGVITGLLNSEYIADVGTVQLFAAAAAATGAIAGAVDKRCLWFAVPAVAVGAILFKNFLFGPAYLVLALTLAAAAVVALRGRSSTGP